MVTLLFMLKINTYEINQAGIDTEKSSRLRYSLSFHLDLLAITLLVINTF